LRIGTDVDTYLRVRIPWILSKHERGNEERERD